MKSLCCANGVIISQLTNICLKTSTAFSTPAKQHTMEAKICSKKKSIDLITVILQ